MKYGFGVDLGGTFIKLAYFSEAGELLDKWEIPTDLSDSGSKILPDIAAAVLGYLKEKNIPKENVMGIGIGVPGPVNRKGVVTKCVNLGWGIFNVSETLSELRGATIDEMQAASLVRRLGITVK